MAMNGLYEGLEREDIIARMESRMKPNGPYYVDTATGLITADILIPVKALWIMVKPPANMWCGKHYEILYRHFSNDLKAPPLRCQNCWKVVVGISTIRQFMALFSLQQNIAPKVYGCKIGKDIREYVNSLYGGYFYSKSLEEGEKCYKLVRMAVNATTGLGPDVPVLLKRGCTEYEMEWGDSMNWKPAEEQQELEAHILSFFKFPKKEPLQPEIVQKHALKELIPWACQHGDKTYTDFVEKPLHATYRTYHDEESVK